MLGLVAHVGRPDPNQTEIKNGHRSSTCFSDFKRTGVNEVLSLLLVTYKLVSGLGVTYWTVMHIALELC